MGSLLLLCAFCVALWIHNLFAALGFFAAIFWFALYTAKSNEAL